MGITAAIGTSIESELRPTFYGVLYVNSGGRWNHKSTRNESEREQWLLDTPGRIPFDIPGAKETTVDQKPSIGRIVHYQAYGTPGGEFPSVPRAACITAVHSDTDVEVFVMNPQGVFFNRVQYSETPKAGHWNWPPRV